MKILKDTEVLSGVHAFVITKHSVSASCQNDPAEYEPLPDSRME